MKLEDINRILKVVQTTYPEIDKKIVQKMWEEYSYINNSTWLELPEKDDVIEMELQGSNMYDIYESERDSRWKIKLANLILDEIMLCCNTAKIDIIKPGITDISTIKTSLGIIDIGDKVKLIIHCEK